MTIGSSQSQISDTFKNPYTQNTQGTPSSGNTTSWNSTSTPPHSLGSSQPTSDNFNSSDPMGTSCNGNNTNSAHSSQNAASGNAPQCGGGDDGDIEKALNGYVVNDASQLPGATQNLDNQILSLDQQVLQELQSQQSQNKGPHKCHEKNHPKQKTLPANNTSAKTNNASTTNQSPSPSKGSFPTTPQQTSKPQQATTQNNPQSAQTPASTSSQKTSSSSTSPSNSNQRTHSSSTSLSNSNQRTSNANTPQPSQNGASGTNGQDNTSQNQSQNKQKVVVYDVPPNSSIWTAGDPGKKYYNQTIAINTAMEAKVEPIIQKALALGAQLFTPTTQSA